ncbi:MULTISPECIES: DUF3325 domain-containing protein [unclassified Acidovorax]|uniref:DUF3325 domain-containing protein n=1 Tax=unclassified Acidovorax TaxID=2684926 RepID=UPI002882E36B|nr:MULTISPECIES: DUF3325 domain-containing protein [unclassified Acidovorax]
MPDALLLTLALIASTLGLAWLALSMEVHWEQVRGAGAALPRRTAVVLRWLGAVALVASFALCIAVDHPSMASLVWFMSLAGGALATAFTLTWRAHWLRPLVAWVAGAGRQQDRSA